MTAIPSRRISVPSGGRTVAPVEATASEGSAERLYSLKPGALWTFMKRQRPSFWLICLYTMFEYVRPQQIYEWMGVIPWSKVLLFLTPLVFLVEGDGFRAKNPLNVLMVLFSSILLLSSLNAVSPPDSFDKIQLYLNWVLVYIFVANTANTEARFLMFTGFFLLWSTKMSQHGVRTWIQNGFHFDSWGATGAPGWFENSGEFGIQMCMFFPLSIYWIAGLRKHWKKWQLLLFAALPASALGSIIATSSRGALIGVALVGFWLVLRSRYKVRALVAITVLSLVVWNLLPPEQKARFDTAGEDQTSVSRMTYWRYGIALTKQYPLLGIGYENWLSYHRNRSRFDRTYLPHNIFIQASAEMGLVGFSALLLLMGGTLYTNYRSRKLMAPLGDRGHFLHSMTWGLDGALIGFIGSGFFITVLFYPFLWFNLAMTAALHAAARKLAVDVAAEASPSQGPVMLSQPRAHSSAPSGRRALALPDMVGATQGSRGPAMILGVENDD